MPIRARCACGKEHVFPDNLEGKEMRCRGCRQRLTVTGERIRDPHAVSWPSRLMVLALALLLTGGVFSVIMYAHHAPLESFTPVADLYEKGSRDPIDPKIDEPRVRSSLEGAAEDLSEGRIAAFADRFHFKRMLAEIERHGGLALITVQSVEDQVLEEIGMCVRSFCGHEHDLGVKWSPIRRCTVRFLEGRGEAEAMAVLRNQGTFLRYRSWLIKEANAWAIFDYENMDSSLRLSSLFGRALRRIAKSWASGHEYQEQWDHLSRAHDLRMQGKHEEALRELGGISKETTPSTLTSQAEFLRAVLLQALGRSSEALPSIDEALRIQKDMPVGIMSRAHILHSLKRYEDAIQSYEEYLRIVGPDATACVGLASAWDQLGRPELASEIFHRLLLAAPDLTEELETLEGIEAFRDRPSIAESIRQAKARLAGKAK
jgi:tetratricopeptide (TPR) repeat protein